ncbi:hypothetical protein Ae168Ps1_6395c [Pseudonocardia sp. Ae168_Ps1]|nr:hypothetical protein [Pseudonocardia sp. Ae168_Ps1]OLL69838.1 hypothetical protein Ae150APs1_6249c [Pseudonocardia sp. Ae150A_Ps1]OLL69970.1 hypothetical protein Ae168Ps1_6395c [Pseudonocardia sp. Ae168_Ps1]
MSLAVATGIPVAAWAVEEHAVLQTAVAILREQEREAGRSGRPSGRRYSG